MPLTPTEFAWQELVKESQFPSPGCILAQGRRKAYANVLANLPGRWYGNPDKVIYSAERAAQRLLRAGVV